VYRGPRQRGRCSATTSTSVTTNRPCSSTTTTRGAGNNASYLVRLPKDPPHQPNQQGTGGTFNFQLHPAIWFGMALCDNESAPEFTHAPCAADSDTNIFDSGDVNDPHYIGKHPGTAFMELQFYPPGWVSWPPGASCDATKWCVAMAIFSLSLDQNTGTANNAGLPQPGRYRAGQLRVRHP
jgi:hypothetical protein